MPETIKPSDVIKPVMGTPWRNYEKEIVAMNIIKLSRFRNGDEWKPFTWDDYVKFCSHQPTQGEATILDNFARTGYLEKTSEGVYIFTKKILDLYAEYTAK